MSHKDEDGHLHLSAAHDTTVRELSALTGGHVEEALSAPNTGNADASVPVLTTSMADEQAACTAIAHASSEAEPRPNPISIGPPAGVPVHTLVPNRQLRAPDYTVSPAEAAALSAAESANAAAANAAAAANTAAAAAAAAAASAGSHLHKLSSLAALQANMTAGNQRARLARWQLSPDEGEPLVVTDKHPPAAYLPPTSDPSASMAAMHLRAHELPQPSMPPVAPFFEWRHGGLECVGVSNSALLEGLRCPLHAMQKVHDAQALVDSLEANPFRDAMPMTQSACNGATP